MSDITAVALTIGETYLERALASLRRQTLPAAATVIVRGVTPFHRALNSGAAQVRTPFFVQLDADVILDDTCLAQLRALMRDDVAIASGLLRDPIVGRALGVRLYRTECVAQVPIRDSISPDLDFTTDTARLGWIRQNALCFHHPDPAHWHTVGEHRPDYTPLYTFSKFRLEGIRARYRAREGRPGRMLRRLCPSAHPASLLALIATAHGFFTDDAADQLAPYRPTADFEALQDFLAAPPGGAAPEAPGDGDDRARRFRDAYAFAIACRQGRAPAAFLAQLQRLRHATDPAAPTALVGLCHGVFEQEYRDERAQRAYAELIGIL
jgi:hypothetical protein